MATAAIFLLAGCGSSKDGSTEASATSATSATVPRLKGLDEDQALAKLRGAGLDVQVIPRDDQAAPGTVIGQNLQPGVSVPAGETVSISVSTGPAPTHKQHHQQAVKPAPPKPTPPPPPPPAPSRYEQAVAGLHRKCGDDGPQLIAYADKAHQLLLQDAGIVESPSSIMIHVNKSLPTNLLNGCDQIFAAYVTLREGG